MSALIIIFAVALLVIAPLVYSIYRKARGFQDRYPSKPSLEEFRERYGPNWTDKYRRKYKPKPKGK
jgi:hypothetical protein